MKKTICIILSLVMLLSVTAGLNFSAYADEVVSISFQLKNAIETFENDDGWIETDGDGNEFFMYDDNFDLYTKGNTFTVTTTSGSTVYTCNEEGEWYDKNYKSLDGFFDYDIYEDQMENHWTVGTNYFTLTYKGAETKVPFKVVKTDVKSMQFNPVNPLKLKYGTDGYYADYKTKKYIYNYYPFNSGDKLTITFTNNTSTVYTFKVTEDYDYFADNKGNQIYVEYFDDQYENPWEVGAHNFSLKYHGFVAQATITVEENNINSISYAPVKPIKITQYRDGDYTYDANGNKYYEYDEDPYYWLYQIGDVLTVNTDEGTEIYTYSVDPDGFECFVDSNGNYSYITLAVYGNQEENHWGVGIHNPKVVYGGVETTVPVEIVENSNDKKIKSVTFTQANPYQLDYDEAADIETDADGNDFRYYYYGIWRDGNKFTVTTDNGVEEYIYSYDTDDYCDKNGKRCEYSFGTYDNQFKNHWKLGKNYFTFYVEGKECEVPIYVVKANHTHIADDPVNEVETAATCTQEGKYDAVVYCKYCGVEMSREKKTAPKLPHTLVSDAAVPATFTSAGKTAGAHCSVCNTVITAQTADAKLVSPVLKLKKAKKSFTASWNTDARVDGYQIQYSLKKNFKKAKTKYSKSNKIKVKKLKSKKTYYVRVRAYKKINGKNVYSAWSTKKVKVK